MLNFMRKHAKFFYIFFFLIIISFIFFYVGPVNDHSPKPVAEIGNERITVKEYWRAYDNVRNTYREIYKDKFDSEMEKKLKLKEMVLMQMVDSRILYVAARDMGLHVTDDELREAIAGEPAFQRDGKFNERIYLRTLQLNRMTPKYFETRTKEELLARKLRQLIEASVVIPDEDIPRIKGNADFLKNIRDTIIRRKKSMAVEAYIEGLKKKYKIIMRAELIA